MVNSAVCVYLPSADAVGAPAVAFETAPGSAVVAAQLAGGIRSCLWALTPWAWKWSTA